MNWLFGKLRISDERLRAVADYVRDWLFGEKREHR